MENRSDVGSVQEEAGAKEAPRTEIVRGKNGRFLPGRSGNPNGRTNLTEEQREALNEIRKLAPRAAEKMQEMLDARETPVRDKIRIIEIILDRTYGRPEAAVRLNAEFSSGEAAHARLEAIAARIRLEVDRDGE